MKQFNAYNEKAVAKLKQTYSLGDKEKIIDVIYKHPIQLIFVFLVTILAYVLVIGFTYFLVATATASDNAQAFHITAFAAFLAAVFAGLILMVATYLFFQTKIIITSENMIVVIQKDLLHGKTSRLALTDIEDVTAEQQGLLATLFDYSHLVIETAGAQVFFTFNYCPRPGYVSKELIDAKEDLVSGAEKFTN